MKHSIQLVIAMALLSFAAAVYGYNALYVLDPRGTQGWAQGTFEKAELYIAPQGLYMNCEMYLTFSARGAHFQPNDTLEVLLYFDLPQEAIVHDLWLWYGDSILYGQLMDKWTANAIYESIVKRRRDPAVLYKTYGGQYELRVFPMAAAETRQVKLSFLMPVNWIGNSVLMDLPSHFLQTSLNPLSNLTVYYYSWGNLEWGKPRILELPDLPFTPAFLPDLKGPDLMVKIPAAAFNTPLHLEMDSPMKDGVYLNRFERDGLGYYQLAFKPAEILNLSSPRKVAFLFDHEQDLNQLSFAEILNAVESMVRKGFSAQDSFNLIISTPTVFRSAEHWIPADSAGIKQAFESLRQQTVSANMKELLLDAVDFINSNGNNGCIFLVAGSDDLNEPNEASAFTDTLLSRMDPVFPVYVLDYQSYFDNWYYLGGRYYHGNQFFYEKLCRETDGHCWQLNNYWYWWYYYDWRDYYYYDNYSQRDISYLLWESLSWLRGNFDVFDFYPEPLDGFCYYRYELHASQPVTPLDHVVQQVGKYAGSFPLQLSLYGFYHGQPFEKEISIPIEQTENAGGLSAKIWAGNHIQAMEDLTQQSDVISCIIECSLSEDVLSFYTAFIALEPNDTVSTKFDLNTGGGDWRDDWGTAINDENPGVVVEDCIIGAYPNPFNSNTRIKISLSSNQKNEKLALRIYNVLGQAVKTFDASQLKFGGMTELVWDGSNNLGQSVSSGVYYFVLSNGGQKWHVKLLLIK